MKTAPLPASLRHRERTAHDLDDRIRQAEERLIAREENLHRRVGQLLGRTKSAFSPQRLLAPVLGVGTALGMLWWTFRGGRARPRPPAAAGGHAASPLARGEVPWVRLVGLAWPLLPLAWRSRVSPGVATAFVSLGLPLMERVIARRRTPPLDTVPALDIPAFSGVWHELAHLPEPLEREGEHLPRRRYAPQADGSIAVTRRWIDPHGDEHEWQASAQPVVGSHGAQWRVSRRAEGMRWLPGAWHDHWVLLHDAAAGCALVGSPDRAQLLLLSRRPRLDEAALQSLLQTALDRGFDVRRLRFAGSAAV